LRRAFIGSTAATPHDRVMRAVIPAAILATMAVAAFAQLEDAAHRADRLRTRSLNERSPTGYAHAREGDVGIDDAAEYRRARAEYLRRLADWRERVVACRAGYTGACGG
jgi:hypothetical protein